MVVALFKVLTTHLFADAEQDHKQPHSKILSIPQILHSIHTVRNANENVASCKFGSVTLR